MSDPAPALSQGDAPARPGRRVIAVIGIDRYQNEGWRPLANAVSDARGAAAMFGKLGFELIAELIDSQATSEAIEGLVADDLTKLGPEDSLVLFYAGHGSTRTHPLGDQVVKTGYLIPYDAADKTAGWIELDAWLRTVSLLPAKHILVILDACHSGIALGSVARWRDGGAQQGLSLSALSALRARRSRRIITSALDNEVALDGGPLPGHSLFTGCLLEALTHGVGHPESPVITGSELGLYLQARVEKYPRSRQTPDFGAFDYDERGEMVLPYVMALKIQPGDGEADDGDGDVVDPVPDHRKRRLIIIGIGAASAVLAILLTWVAARVFGGDDNDRAQPAGLVSAPPRAGRPAVDEAAGAPESQESPESRGGCLPGMVRVPAGTFAMGSPKGEGLVTGEPQHSVTLSAAFCIDKTEVTVKAYLRCVAADRCTTIPARERLRLLDPRSSDRFWWCNDAKLPDHPINCVTWDQAVAYCKWAGKRLPTEAEWEYAARGSDGRRYPWGNEPPNASRLNACGSECVRFAERELTLQWRGMYNEDDGWPTTAPVGSHRAGASAFGALDMAGNVAEWTEDWFDWYTPAAETDPRHPERTGQHVARGGSWMISAAVWIRAASRDRLPPDLNDLGVGIRCAWSDPPAQPPPPRTRDQ